MDEDEDEEEEEEEEEEEDTTYVYDILCIHTNARGGRNQSKTLEEASFRGHDLETPPTNSAFEAPSLRGHQLDTPRPPPLPSSLFSFACPPIARCCSPKRTEAEVPQALAQAP
jgi:hypothetical protein